MRIGVQGGDLHLGYCTNVHPSASLPEVLSSLSTHVAAVKARVCPSEPFGVGVWLSQQAASALAEEGGPARLAATLRELGLYVFTLNGFPFGAFHGQQVKTGVYHPDWRQRARLTHTNLLATLLAELLPSGVDGSVSTLPGAFARELSGERAGEHDEALIAAHLLEHAAYLHALEARTGKRVTLAIEPEPCCMLETTAQTVAFFERRLYGPDALRRLAELCGVGTGAAGELARRHLGVCLDACHAAVEYEEPGEVLRALQAAQIPIAKLQLSAGLRAAPADHAARTALARFAEPVYLHQVIERTHDGTLVRHEDLPDALRSAPGEEHEWRVHFHVPLHRARFGVLESTQPFVRELLAAQRARPFTRQLEVETYTWEVLPEEERPAVLADGLADELRFCLRELGHGAPP